MVDSLAEWRQVDRTANREKPAARGSVFATPTRVRAGSISNVRMAVWEHYQTFASDVLIRFGEFNPDEDYPHQNGHA
jgi:hypothetical protein